MDVTFFVQNGLYSEMNTDIVLEIIIHTWALGIGAWIIVYNWRRRRLLLKSTKRGEKDLL